MCAGEAVRVECGGIWEAGWREQEALGTGRVLALELGQFCFRFWVLAGHKVPSGELGQGSVLQTPQFPTRCPHR